MQKKMSVSLRRFMLRTEIKKNYLLKLQLPEVLDFTTCRTRLNPGFCNQLETRNAN
jgi:hypothetical protein